MPKYFTIAPEFTLNRKGHARVSSAKELLDAITEALRVSPTGVAVIREWNDNRPIVRAEE